MAVRKYGGVFVVPEELHQVSNDTETDVFWLMLGAPDEAELQPGAKTDISLFYSVDPKQFQKGIG